MLYFKLDKIMDDRGLNINKVSSETKISRPSLTAIYNNESRGVQFDTLEKLMKYLNVHLNDLIEETKETATLKFENSISKVLNNATNVNDLNILVKDSDKVLPGGELQVFSATITIHSKINKDIVSAPFHFVIKIVRNPNNPTKILSLSSLFYRSNSKDEPLDDVTTAINSFAPIEMKSFISKILDSWLKTYKKIKSTFIPDIHELDDGLILFTMESFDKTLSKAFPIQVKTTLTKDKYFSYETLDSLPFNVDAKKEDSIAFTIKEI